MAIGVGLLVLMLLMDGAGEVATIYRCTGVAGEVYFTDRGCPAGVPQRLDPAQILVIPALDAADWARVRQLDDDNVRRRRARALQADREARSTAAAEAARARQCAAARAGLERIRQIKRHGYAAASAADLAARQRKYALQFDKHCR
jgi:hypothetical protein